VSTIRLPSPRVPVSPAHFITHARVHDDTRDCQKSCDFRFLFYLCFGTFLGCPTYVCRIVGRP